jgi:fructose-bisphosphate aldolase class I
MDKETLKKTARQMVAPGRGILAIDESHGTCEKRFKAVGVPFDEDHRRQYRQLLITAEGVNEGVSGMILFDETLRQKTDDGTPFPKALEDRNMLPGIKVDKGAKDLALHPGEKVTEGLDGLRDRLAEYKELGAKFAKWRAVIAIGNGLPSDACIHANAHALARYAALCQEAGLVPIVEPEILLDGDHTIETCYEVSVKTWKKLFEEIAEQGVNPEGAILKTSMILSGKDCPQQADLDTIAKKTVEGLKEGVPDNIGGIVFLSGGQGDVEATERLNRMHQICEFPWPLSFSYGRSIQRPALKIWAEDNSKIKEAQAALAERGRLNGLATKGEYSTDMEK